MNAIRLPKSLQSGRESTIEDSRQITIIGGNGAGKTRFMEEMMEECGEKAYCLSAISAFYAEREESTRANSIDAQYRQAVKQRSYMRTDLHALRRRIGQPLAVEIRIDEEWRAQRQNEAVEI